MDRAAAERLHVIAEIEDIVAAKHDSLKPIADAWQPADFLPHFSREDWADRVRELQCAAAELPDQLFVVLVGSTVTEEALPSYQSCLTRTEGLGDPTGASSTPWARWSRSWTAEENRHGDLLNRYLFLSGRVDMRAVERSIQNLIGNGFDPGHENNPYNLLVYTSFQEQATRISHAKTGQIARKFKAEVLWKICGAIAGDEARHECAYQAFMKRVFELDPAGAVLAFDEMLKRKIRMPAALLTDCSGTDVFACFVNVAQELGVYTFDDYAGIIEELISQWNVAGLPGLTGAAAEAQERVCSLPGLYRRRIHWLKTKTLAAQEPPFPWPWLTRQTAGIQRTT